MKEMIDTDEHIRRLEKVRDVALARDHYSAILCDALLSVMERLEAMEQPPKVAWAENEPRTRVEYVGTVTATTVAEIERAAMIKALRWSANNATCGHTLCSGMRVIADEVRRLENGGEM